MTSPATPATTAVIGAGPVGLAAAAHLLERGMTPIVLEAGPSVGAAVAEWGHVRLFSPWRYDIDAAAARLLTSHGWTAPDPDALPAGAELVESYLEPLAAAPEIAPHLRLGARVIAVTREGADKTRTLGRERRPYLLRVRTADGQYEDITAEAVIDASGTWGRSNPLGAHGLAAPGETADAPWRAGPLPDVLGRERDRFASRRTLVLGMGHSAANTLLALAELAETAPRTEVLWAIRGGSPRRLYGGGASDALPARGALGTRLKELVDTGRIELTTRIGIERFDTAPDGSVAVVGRAGDEAVKLDVHNVVGATGFRPDLEMLREVRLELDATVEAPARIASLIDPNFHSCGTVPPHGEKDLAHPDEGFYLAGMKSYGRAPTFLLATGYEQVRSIAAALAGDREAADGVELDLPETGVCSTDLAAEADAPRGLSTGVLHGRSGEPIELTPAGGGCCGSGN